MRIESAVTSISWIPSEAITGITRLPMDIGMGRYDDPPPDDLGPLDAQHEMLEALRDADRFRFANHLAVWAEVSDGAITSAGYAGGGLVGATSIRLGPARMTVAGVGFPDQRTEPLIEGGTVRFTQTAGGRTGAPMPRKVSRPPFVRISSPTAWTTLTLTLRADGSSEFDVAGASPFPRHWIYDAGGALAAKSGIIDFKEWSQVNYGDHTPWGSEETQREALLTAVETELERSLSLTLMREGKKPVIRDLAEGEALVTQSERGDSLFVVLDGVLRVDVDGEPLAELGPGTVVGERAALEGGVRTATLTALTPVKVAEAPHDTIDPVALERLAEGHRREEG